eukprot:CAMPEP_0181301768 /NCGR_PEP_ID=MMETSP1101-20121128/7606_1 /TAXON_ID=46948 /ORGANISM="Rhodomonas abbreviata, Strain Caron Lab Isolate" /LENGTH=117 /DNA_ID=CAMNT_0023407107 /DNA_START=117 /DNA_END=470 /DNA_ORIENTATION=+
MEGSELLPMEDPSSAAADANAGSPGEDHSNHTRGGKAQSKRKQNANNTPDDAFTAWKKEWEEDWGTWDEWATEAGHTAKLALLAPITTFNILGKVIYDSVQDDDLSQRFDDPDLEGQ